VQVEPIAQQVERHDDALGVPPGPTRPERRVPRGLAGLGGLPQREVERRTLLGVDLHPGPRAQGIERLAGQEPVAVHLLDIEIDPRRGRVGDPSLDEIGHQRHHGLDVRRGVGSVVRAQDPEGLGRLPPGSLELPGHLRFGATLGGGAIDDPVVDVGHVRDMVDLEAREGEVPADDVEDERLAAVPDVGEVVDRQAADVHGSVAGIAQLQRPHDPGCGVVEAQHPGTVTRS
jgi:hypothetical protein